MNEATLMNPFSWWIGRSPLSLSPTFSEFRLTNRRVVAQALSGSRAVLPSGEAGGR